MSGLVRCHFIFIMLMNHINDMSKQTGGFLRLINSNFVILSENSKYTRLMNSFEIKYWTYTLKVRHSELDCKF